MGAAIAQWIRLRLPFCCPGFQSQAYHLSFYKIIGVSCRKDENKRKEAGIGPFFFKKILEKLLSVLIQLLFGNARNGFYQKVHVIEQGKE